MDRTFICNPNTEISGINIYLSVPNAEEPSYKHRGKSTKPIRFLLDLSRPNLSA